MMISKKKSKILINKSVKNTESKNPKAVKNNVNNAFINLRSLL